MLLLPTALAGLKSLGPRHSKDLAGSLHSYPNAKSPDLLKRTQDPKTHPKLNHSMSKRPRYLFMMSFVYSAPAVELGHRFAFCAFWERILRVLELRSFAPMLAIHDHGLSRVFCTCCLFGSHLGTNPWLLRAWSEDWISRKFYHYVVGKVVHQILIHWHLFGFQIWVCCHICLDCDNMVVSIFCFFLCHLQLFLKVVQMLASRLHLLPKC